MADRTNTFATAVLGLTLQCARCHDHKYDPFSQRDYYQLFAYFNTLDERGQINYFDLAPSPNMRVEDAALEAQISWLDAMINLQEQRLNAHLSSQDAAFDRWASSKLSDLEAQALLGEGLQAHYTFDSFSALSSPNEVPRAPLAKANTGLVRELEAPQQVAGKLGAGLRFDGHNFMNLGDVGDFEWHEHFSLGAWIWTPQAPQKAAALLSRRNGEQKRGGYELLLTPGRRLQASLIHNFRKERITVQSTGRVKLNSWTHVALTYDGSGKAEGLRLYLNGRESPLRILEDQLNRQSILTGNDFLAGHWTHRNLQNGELQGFEGGSMDDIRLYSRTLSGYEVGLMAGRQPGELPLKEAYPLYLRIQSAAFRQQAQLLDSLRSEWREVPYVMIMQEADSPRATHLLRRGAYDAPGERVYPGTPAALPPMPPDFPPNRLGLARWLCLPGHPLTARVMVNRCWQIMFGRGLVNTAEDFGSQGEIPSHPALLDWLAVDFVENGWNVKRLMKQIALSATYRQSARIAPSTYKKDPANIWLARGPNQRLSAEMLRDNALAISGLLHREVGGKWVKPYQPPGLWRALANQIGENKYRPSKGHRLYRRSLYTYWKRTIPPPMMLTFDAAERTVCVVKRQSTNTPLQALVLLNDPQFVEASRLMGARMLKEGGHTPEERLRWGFRLATSRWPSQTEQAELMQLWHTLEQSRRQNPQSLTKALLEVGAYPLPEETEPDELLLYTLIANTLLNLDEAKMKS
ncbi:MAG: DUF1553 domain-containing protein [Bacteroidetes bacterium]|nr:MAG: DUF1553 domain-containing protein [Bacteroidota bacterium]